MDYSKTYPSVCVEFVQRHNRYQSTSIFGTLKFVNPFPRNAKPKLKQTQNVLSASIPGILHGNTKLTKKMESSRSKKQLVTDRSNITSTIRKNVLGGAFTVFPSSADWKTPSFKLIPFISSTFTDTQLERNCLLNLLFEMRGIAKKDGKDNYSLYFFVVH